MSRARVSGIALLMAHATGCGDANDTPSEAADRVGSTAAAGGPSVPDSPSGGGSTATGGSQVSGGGTMTGGGPGTEVAEPGPGGTGGASPPVSGSGGEATGGTGGSESGSGQGGSSQGGCSYRIGYSADGNQHDYDDHHASPMVLALIARAGLQHCLVHFDYNNHLGDNDPEMAAEHARRVVTLAERFGFDSEVFFDDQERLPASLASIRAAVNASSSSDPLMFILAGPMEVPWRGIDAADDDREPFVTVFSHHSWNNGHLDTPQLRHGWSDIVDDFNVQTDHLGGWPDSNQNDTAWKSHIDEWQWLPQIDEGQLLLDYMSTRPGRGDASDAGMVFYLLTGRGDASATMANIKSFLMD